jgi:hypothetical protein
MARVSAKAAPPVHPTPGLQANRSRRRSERLRTGCRRCSVRSDARSTRAASPTLVRPLTALGVGTGPGYRQLSNDCQGARCDDRERVAVKSVMTREIRRAAGLARPAQTEIRGTRSELELTHRRADRCAPDPLRGSRSVLSFGVRRRCGPSPDVTRPLSPQGVSVLTSTSPSWT